MPAQQLHPRFLDRLNSTVEEGYPDENFGVRELARQLGLSRSQLHRKIRSYLDKSPSQYLREYRLRKAVYLLQDDDLTAAEIAYRVGFRSPTYFSSCYHAHYGMPPGQSRYRIKTDRKKRKRTTQQRFLRRYPSSYLRYFIGGVAGIAFLLVLLYSFILLRGPSDPKANNDVQAAGVTVEDHAAKGSIAVLPIRNWSGNPDLEYISEGLTDAIISRLSGLDGFSKVIPYTSVMRYRQSSSDMGEIASELQVNYLLQGNFQLANEEVHINFQLIHGPTNEHLWSKQFTKLWDSSSIFDLQVELAEKIATLLEVDVADTELTQINYFPTRNQEAYHKYLQAEYFKKKNDPMAFEEAVVLYEEAIALDTNFIEAYTGLADTFIKGGLFWGNLDQRNAWAQARKLLDYVLAMDEGNEESHRQLFAGMFYYDWDFEGAEEYYHGHDPKFRRAFTSTPAAIDYAIKTGKADEALVDVQMNLHRNPNDRQQYILKARVLQSLEKPREAEQLLQTFEAFFRDDLYLLLGSAEQYYKLGNYPRTAEKLVFMERQFKRRPPALLWLQASLSRRSGDLSKAERFLLELRSRYENQTSGSPAWYLSLYYAESGQEEEAVKWLKRSYQTHEVALTGLREETLLGPLKQHHEYQRIYQEMGFSIYD